MQKLTALIVVGILLCASRAATAGSIEDGQAAFDRGDYATASSLWRPMAEQGDAKAQFNLGKMYQQGYGVPQDYVRAYMWFNVVASSPNGETGKQTTGIRERLASAMTPLQIALAESMAKRCQQLNYKGCEDFNPSRITATISAPSAGAKPDLPTPSSRPANMAPPSFVQTIRMQEEGGVYVVPVLVNNSLRMTFIVDSGASYVSIPADIVLKMMRTGTLKDADFLGTRIFRLADGSTLPSQTFRIRSLKIGDRTILNVAGNIAPPNGSLLLGQSFLRRIKSWSIDNTRHTLVLE